MRPLLNGGTLGGREFALIRIRVSNRFLGVFFLLGAGCASTGHRQTGVLAPNAPADRPGAIRAESPDEAFSRWQSLIAPHSQEALATYPGARQRYLQRLPAGENFFVTIILRDSARRFEQVFMLVDRIDSGAVTGRIASDIVAVDGYHRGETLTFPEKEIVDWLISKPDGSEEGNFVGKFLDTLPSG
jgi:hypothetical protein